MNKFFTYIFALLIPVVFAANAFAQGGRSPVNDVLNALRSNRVEEISRYFDNFVPVTINNSQNNYSHNQAEIVLRDFFDRNPPRDFRMMDIGSAGNSSQYGIAAFTSGGGKYNVYVLMRQNGSSYQIKEIKINRE